MIVNEEKGLAGRKLTKDYFDRFEILKSIGEGFELPLTDRYDPHYLRMRLLNQARSYGKFNNIKFKIQTRIENGIVKVMRTK